MKSCKAIWAACVAMLILVPVCILCGSGTQTKYVKGKVNVMEKQTKKFDWNKRIGKSDKGTSDYVKPAIAYGASGGALVLAIAIALIVILPLA